jgi:hypothetical protein
VASRSGPQPVGGRHLAAREEGLALLGEFERRLLDVGRAHLDQLADPVLRDALLGILAGLRHVGQRLLELGSRLGVHGLLLRAALGLVL